MDSLVEVRTVVGADELDFQCRVCSQIHSTDVFRFKTVDKWLGILPVWVTYETTLKCPNCDTTFRCKEEIEVLQQRTTEEIGLRFRVRVGFVQKFLVVAGWLLCFTGPIALVLLLIAWFQLPKAATSWRTATKFGFAMPFAFYPVVILIFGLLDLLWG